MRYSLLLSMFLLLLCGCGPELSEHELGTVVNELPKVEGADKPYPMPQLGPPPASQDAIPARRGR